MKCLILVNAYVEKDSYLYQAKRMKEELEKRGVSCDIIKNSKYSVYIENGNILSDYSGYDFVIFWDKDKYIGEMLEKSGLKVFNRPDSILTCDDKMTTHIMLSNNGIPMPKTYPGILCYSNEHKIQKETFDLIEKKLGYPMICKHSYGSLGQGVFLINNRKELEDISEDVKIVPHLFQQFISESAGKDLRVIVVGDKVLGGMVRQSLSNDFKSNIGAGGSGKIYPVSKEVADMCLKIKNILNLDYCGIDILFGNSGPIVCEVNSNAFFEAFEKVTGINVAKEYTDYILKKVSKK